ncbi:hypothetical protein ACFL27_27455 [candidate division CSSED10-310 bacterium]|uniref:Uncharacterized protein n=1 Tax=candidate division CSSED10-310 bacterium TaxID=2855610 RepID=A0ABV6Z664_UNCC1
MSIECDQYVKNPKLKDTLFSYTAPKEATVIDLTPLYQEKMEQLNKTQTKK